MSARNESVACAGVHEVLSWHALFARVSSAELARWTGTAGAGFSSGCRVDELLARFARRTRSSALARVLAYATIVASIDSGPTALAASFPEEQGVQVDADAEL